MCKRPDSASRIQVKGRFFKKIDSNLCFSDLSDSLNSLNLPNSLNSPNFRSIKGKFQWRSGKTPLLFSNFVSNFIMIIRSFGMPGNFISRLDVTPHLVGGSKMILCVALSACDYTQSEIRNMLTTIHSFSSRQ